MNVRFTHINDKKAAVFETTLALIAQHGFHGTAMSMIAKSAQVATGTIYHYFPSKDCLIEELHLECKIHLNKQIFKGIKEIKSYKGRFFTIWKRFIRTSIENPDMFGFLEQYYSSPYSEHGGKTNRHSALSENNICDFLVEGIKTKALKDLDINILLTSYIGIAISTVKTVLYAKVNYSETQIGQLIQIVWDGVKNEKKVNAPFTNSTESAYESSTTINENNLNVI